MFYAIKISDFFAHEYILGIYEDEDVAHFYADLFNENQHFATAAVLEWEKKN